MAMLEKLTNCRQKRDSAQYNVFCFPWAGGGSGFYAGWCQYLPNHIEVHGIRLPGRESRLREPLYRDLSSMVQDIVTILLPKLRERPFMFFGHSLGALLCYEVARSLVRNHSMQPEHLFASGALGPHSPLRQKHRKGWAKMSESQFLDNLRKLGGTPPEVMANEGLMKLFLPCIRSEFKIVEEYDDPPPAKPYLSCPLTFFHGTEDFAVPQDEWTAVTTSKSFHSELLPGGHFYLMQAENTRRICARIADILPKKQ
ncbi:S-acyl fatty acid synthase thioesterase, medium chain-like [Diadema setosum]|uniref:S-acyl fatty acid synthase thioesterase, medium chain-like n=1 Tax=Diadema setosum TaxID=31175 RepID=UPI003B3B1B34